MIYFSEWEIFSACAAFFTLGLFFGGVYASFNRVLEFILFLITLFKKIIKKYMNLSKIQKANENTFKNRILSDFIFVFTLGIIFILLQYIFLDAMFRIFSLAVFLFGFIAGYKTLGKLFMFILKGILSKTEILIFYIMYYFLYPFYFFLKLFHRIFSPIFNKVNYRIGEMHYKAVTGRKKKKIDRFFKKAL